MCFWLRVFVVVCVLLCLVLCDALSDVLCCVVLFVLLRVVFCVLYCVVSALRLHCALCVSRQSKTPGAQADIVQARQDNNGNPTAR